MHAIENLIHAIESVLLGFTAQLYDAVGWLCVVFLMAVFVSRLLPVVSTFISVPAGLAHMNLWRFSLYTFAGSYIWSLGLAYRGYLLGENWEQLRSAMRPFDIPILLVIAAAFGWFLWRRIRAIRSQSLSRKTVLLRKTALEMPWKAVRGPSDSVAGIYMVARLTLKSP